MDYQAEFTAATPTKTAQTGHRHNLPDVNHGQAWHWENADSRRRSRQQPAEGLPLRDGELCRSPRTTAGEGTLWPRRERLPRGRRAAHRGPRACAARHALLAAY